MSNSAQAVKDKWASYARKNTYAKDIKYEETLECLEQFIEIIVPVTI